MNREKERDQQTNTSGSRNTDVTRDQRPETVRDASLEDTISNQRTSADMGSSSTTKNVVAGSDRDGQL